jgi:hypothetical protein
MRPLKYNWFGWHFRWFTGRWNQFILWYQRDWWYCSGCKKFHSPRVKARWVPADWWRISGYCSLYPSHKENDSDDRNIQEKR